jgi:hypothetical protein
MHLAFARNMDHVHKHFQKFKETMFTSFGTSTSTIYHHTLVMRKNNPSKSYFARTTFFSPN